MPSDESRATIVDRRRRILGILWIVYGIIRLVMSFVLFAFTPTATVMFGALLSRVADPFTLMSEFHIWYTFAIILSVLCGIFGLIAGLALLGNGRPARTLALIAAFLSVSEIPLGTTLGIYALVVLLPSRESS
jgi:uncharacterized membrane protein HdeD (DUF308 family)